MPLRSTNTRRIQESSIGLQSFSARWKEDGVSKAGNDRVFSLGMVFAYLAYKGQFTTQASSLIDEIIGLRLLSLHKERLSDIVLAPEDVGFVQTTASPTKLIGALELRNVSFSYSTSEPLVLDQVNLVVKSGEHIAITGPSGGGKSTLLKVLLGLLDPLEGSVLVDEVTLSEFGHQSFYRQIAVVMQDDSLFSGTLAENIALFDEHTNFSRVLACAEAAAIHNDIESMPMKYDTMVGDMGSALSGGQKQRLLLARALYRQPRILLMDEGTAHLDVMLEKTVNAAIAKLGITRVIIAHRPDTIAAADRVYLMQDRTLRELSV